MIKKRYTVLFFAMLAAGILLNGILVFLTAGSGDFVNVGQRGMTRKMLREADRILAGYDHSEYERALSELKAELKNIKEYEWVFERTENGTVTPSIVKQHYSQEEISGILTVGNYVASESIDRVQILSYCIERISSALAYPEYARRVVADAVAMSEISIFGDASLRRILKTAADFYGNVNIRVSAESDAGVNGLFKDSLTDVLAVLMMFVCALLYYLRCHEKVNETVVVKGRIGLFSFFAAAGALLLYVTGILVSNAGLSLGNLNRAIQSVEDFYTCPYLLSVGTLIGIRVAFKVAVCLVLFLFFVGILFGRSKRFAVTLGLTVLAAEFLLELSDAGVSVLGTFHAERFVTAYSVVPVFDEPVNAGWPYALFLLILFVTAAVFAGKNVSAKLLLEKERREQAYFDKINSAYTETRLIRHDIHNHLAAIAMLMDEGRAEEARRYLGRVSDELNEVRPPVKTGSSVLDAVLFSKTRDAKEKGIEIETVFEADFAGSGISDYDLCSVFGNLLDNAAEACEKLSDADRKIALKVKRQENMFCIYCENRYREIRRENGTLVTVKSDRQAHGLGLKGIGRVAKKYGGYVDVRDENGLFSISVLLIAR